MTEYRAADLPVGSVVKGSYVQWEKFREPTDRDISAWESELGDRWPDRYIDRALNEGAQVLRVGTEQEEG